MPNIKSQVKRDKQNIKRSEKNQALKTRIKTLNKKFRKSVEGKDIEKARENMDDYFKVLDKAAKTNTVHKNFAANKKSKAAKLLNKTQGA
jgi:small subunit ribosomal protein S20